MVPITFAPDFRRRLTTSAIVRRSVRVPRTTSSTASASGPSTIASVVDQPVRAVVPSPVRRERLVVGGREGLGELVPAVGELSHVGGAEGAQVEEPA